MKKYSALNVSWFDHAHKASKLDWTQILSVITPVQLLLSDRCYDQGVGSMYTILYPNM